MGIKGPRFRLMLVFGKLTLFGPCLMLGRFNQQHLFNIRSEGPPVLRGKIRYTTFGPFLSIDVDHFSGSLEGISLPSAGRRCGPEELAARKAFEELAQSGHTGPEAEIQAGEREPNRILLRTGVGFW